MKFTEEKIQEIVDSFPFEEYDRNKYYIQWDFTEDDSIIFLNDNAIIVMVLQRWNGNDWEEDVSRVKVALTGDLEDDLRFGITNLLNKANNENNS